MKHRKISVLIVLLISLFGCVLLFGCGGAEPPVPEVKDVALTAVDGSPGKVGARHRLSYTATEGAEISVSVARGEHAATAADFVCLGEEYIFYTAGSYTLTVYASKDGMLGSGSATLSVTDDDVFVSDVKLEAVSGETYGKVGALHALSYSAKEGSEIDVAIEKDGAPAEDAVFDEAASLVTFGSAGSYTVTVTAAAGGKSASGSAHIDITATEAPKVSVSFDEKNVKEEETVTLTRTAVCAEGDAVADEKISVLYRKGSSGDPSEANAESYTLKGDRFTPHMAGNWKIVYTVHTKGGAESEADGWITCRAADVKLSKLNDVRHRIQTGTPYEAGYLVEGAADKYDISFDTHGNGNVTAEKGEGNSVRVTASAADYFTVTVVYRHKVTSTTKQTVDIDFYSVDSLTYAPAWGEDPFGGMPGDVLTSMGHLLYFDAVSCGGLTRELTARDAKFEVYENNVTASSGSNAVEILYAAGDEAYPYVIVSNFDNNVATGNFTLKMTLTDPATGYAAVAYKTFNVLATTNDNTTAANFIQNYVRQHADFFHMGSMDYSNLCSDCRHNMVLTKTGTIMQRTNPSWTLNGNNADFAKMDLPAASGNCRLEFRFGQMSPNPATGELWLGIGVRTGTKDGWAGFFDLHLSNGKLTVTNGLSGAKSETYAGELPAPSEISALWVRIDRRVSGNTVYYTVSVKTEENGQYTTYFTSTFDVSSSAGAAGTPVAQYQFTHRNAGGCYSVEDVNVTSFD